MTELYKALELAETSTLEEIKTSYRRLLRKYPPEQYPHDFERIRRAYETLSNPRARASYDAISRHKEEIEHYAKIGNEAMDDENFETAIKSFKKILLIEPSLTYARDLLGTALYLAGEHQKAAEQFLRCVADDPDNAGYQYHLGSAYQGSSLFDKADECFAKAHALDPINHNIVTSWASLKFYQQKDFDGAVKVLRKAINYDGEVDFEDFIYLFKLIEITIVGGTHNISPIIKEIEAIVPKDPDVRIYVAYRFAQQADNLLDIKAHGWAHEMAKVAANFAPDDLAVKELLQDCRMLAEMHRLFKKLDKDTRVPPQIVGPIFYHLHWTDVVGSTGESKAEALRQENIDAILSIAKHGFREVLSGIGILRQEYGLLYAEFRELYEDVERVALKHQQRDAEFSRLRYDTQVISGFKNIIVLWLSENLSEWERERRFDNAWQEIRGASRVAVRFSLKWLKTQYPLLYSLNDKFFKDVQEAVS